MPGNSALPEYEPPASVRDPGLSGFLLAVYAAIQKQHPPVPIQRSIAVPAGEGIIGEIDWYGSILLSLSILAGKLPSLPPSLAGGLPAIHAGSTREEIALANAAALNALNFVIEGLKQHDVELNFNVDHNHAEDIPSQAYFVLHHGDTYGITANTIAITEMYDAWLQSAGFGQ
jgi:hypothetical protein